MAVAVLGHYDRNLIEAMSPTTRRLDRRHYKKDSRFVLDLYTLTYDEHESLDSLGDLTDRRFDSLKTNINFKHNGRNTATGYRFRKPSLQSRMQDGKNIQLYFMSEQSSEVEDMHVEDGILSLPVIPQSNYYNSQDKDLVSLPEGTMSELEMCHRLAIHSNCTEMDNSSSDDNNNKNYHVLNTVDRSTGRVVENINGNTNNQLSSNLRHDAYTSLKTVCEETRRKLDGENQRSDSPITCTIKTSLKKVGAESKNSCGGRQRMNRHMLTNMNVRQLQEIINDLHPHVEYLNEQLMKMLMERDELHMKRDSLLVDIEDMVAYFDPKQMYKEKEIRFCQPNENKNNVRKFSNNSCTKSFISGLRFNRLASYIKN